MSDSDNLKGKFNVLPTSVRVDGIEIMDFVPNLSELFKMLPDLGAIRGSTLNFNFPAVSFTITWTGKESFNISCTNPKFLDELVTVLKTFYDGQ